MFLNIQIKVLLSVVMTGKTFLDVYVLFCRASFRDDNFTSAKIFSAS